MRVRTAGDSSRKELKKLEWGERQARNLSGSASAKGRYVATMRSVVENLPFDGFRLDMGVIYFLAVGIQGRNFRSRIAWLTIACKLTFSPSSQPGCCDERIMNRA